ncbi:MAG: adenine phosphoribosyltransferase [Coriobacteriia bacterium]|nr:adenine phosphoribosyltransferase [Coriobacteriia bacterium]
MNEWPDSWEVGIGLSEPIKLPLVRSDDGFGIYALDMMGQHDWNEAAASALYEKLGPYDFDIILTAEAKAIGLAQELSQRFGHSEYIVLRKSHKLYMPSPVSVQVQSITTTAPQTFFLGQDKIAKLAGLKACVLDDVLSTGGTMTAMLQMAKIANCLPVVIAVVLTEDTDWDEFAGLPVVKLDYIPLPGTQSQVLSR